MRRLLDDLEGGFTNSADEQCRIAPSPSTNQLPGSSQLQYPVQWPRIEQLHLSASDVVERRRSIGGSDANTILSGDCERIRQLWFEKRGEADAPDLSDKISVMLGCWTEAFNQQWYEQLTGEQVSDLGRSFTCTSHDWRRCTVDGLVQGKGAIWEAKHTSAFASRKR